MPLSPTQLSRNRIDFLKSLTSKEIDSLIHDNQIKVLQTVGPVARETWRLINQTLCVVRPDVEIRAYGFYGELCDLSFVRDLPNVQRFAVDCLMDVEGVEHLSSLPNLKHLSVGIYHLKSFEFLDGLAASGLESLSLGATKSKKPSLSHIERFKELRQLFVEGPHKNAEVIGVLKRLEVLMLRSMSVTLLEFLQDLKNLWSLDIKLGGTKDLSALKGMNGIKYLELWQIKGLEDISVISTLLGLQYLFLQSLPRINRLPDLSKLKGLRRVYLENMKGLDGVSELEAAPALEELMHCDARGMSPEQYKCVLQNPSLKSIFVGFGSTKKNNALRELASRAGKREFARSEFSFK